LRRSPNLKNLAGNRAKIKFHVAAQGRQETNFLKIVNILHPPLGGAIIKKIASFRHKTQKFFFFGGFIAQNFLADTPFFLFPAYFILERPQVC
jgi:hypothetical protein